MNYLPKSKRKKAALILILIFGLLQLVPKPKKNISSTVAKNSIEQLYPLPDSVLKILNTACYDCHSNNTYYPWYNNIQPVAWFLNKHILEGKVELNFDEFGSYSNIKQQNKLKSIVNQLKDGDMPLISYEFLHSHARLSKHETVQIIKWINSYLEK